MADWTSLFLDFTLYLKVKLCLCEEPLSQPSVFFFNYSWASICFWCFQGDVIWGEVWWQLSCPVFCFLPKKGPWSLATTNFYALLCPGPVTRPLFSCYWPQVLLSNLVLWSRTVCGWSCQTATSPTFSTRIESPAISFWPVAWYPYHLWVGKLLLLRPPKPMSAIVPQHTLGWPLLEYVFLLPTS